MTHAFVAIQEWVILNEKVTERGSLLYQGRERS